MRRSRMELLPVSVTRFRAWRESIFSRQGTGEASGFAPKLTLSALDGSNGFRLDGMAAHDWSGSSAAGAADVNGDGFADMIIGAYRADPGGVYDAGSSYVVFGRG